MINKEPSLNDLKRAVKLIESVKWQFAKTMPQTPHSYTVRKWWWDDKDFVWLVLFIREFGYRTNYSGRDYIYFDLNGYSYWTMGCAINLNGSPYTIILNRAYKNDLTSGYDSIAKEYDVYFRKKEYTEENQKLMNLIGPLNGSVLDVGCGTGLFLDYNKPKKYVGIDSSKGMLQRLSDKHKGYAEMVYNTSIEDFIGNTYDNIVCLFSSGHIENPEEILRFWNKREKFIMTFEQPHYSYISDEVFELTESKYRHDKKTIEELFSTKAIDFGNYYIIKL